MCFQLAQVRNGYTYYCKMYALSHTLQVHNSKTTNITELETLDSFENAASRIPLIDLLRGRDGRDGLPGRDGEKGAQGEQGPAGPQGDQGPPGPRSAGVTYIRWGKNCCPNVTGTEEVYNGRVGGSIFNNNGGGAEKLCMPPIPDYINAPGSVVTIARSTIHGTEYQTHYGPIRSLLNQNVPCAVCYASTRAAMIMVPAKTQCPSSWTREYYGYLMTEVEDVHHYRTSFDCVDVNHDVVAGGASDSNGAMYYHVVASCNGLQCPPYEVNRVMSCAVCTK